MLSAVLHAAAVMLLVSGSRGQDEEPQCKPAVTQSATRAIACSTPRPASETASA